MRKYGSGLAQNAGTYAMVAYGSGFVDIDVDSSYRAEIAVGAATTDIYVSDARAYLI